jgi:tape measure domain-containing protein
MAGRFEVDAVIKAIDKFSKPIRNMQNSVAKFGHKANRSLEGVTRSLRKVDKGLMSAGRSAVRFAAIGIGAATTAVVGLVSQFAKIEDAQAAFTPLLGGAEKAKELVDRLNETSATTPFQFKNLADSANQLLPVMNGNIEDTIKTIRMLGDTSGGNAQKLDSITRGFTKAMLKGKVDMESLNMIAEAGVPIFTELAESMGTEVNEAFFKMISAGKVTTKDLTAAFEKMTSEGGIFFGGMEIASKTTSGIFSTLKDNISLTAAEIGSILAPTIKDLLKELILVAQNVREWVKANKELISERFLTFVDTLKSFFKFLSQNGKTILKVAGYFAVLIVALKTLTALLTLTTLLMALPFGPVIAGILAVVAAIGSIVFWFEEWTDAIRNTGMATKFIVLAIGAAMGPIGFLITAATLIISHWKDVKAVFIEFGTAVMGVWESVSESITKAFAVIFDKFQSRRPCKKS